MTLINLPKCEHIGVPNGNIYLKKSANGFLIDNDREFIVGIFLTVGCKIKRKF